MECPPSPDLRDEDQFGDYVLPEPALIVKFPIASIPQRVSRIALRADPLPTDISKWRAEGYPCPGAIVGNHYEVHRLSRTYEHNGYRWFLVEWAGWPPQTATWEPIAHLAGCPDLLRAIYEANGWDFP